MNRALNKVNKYRRQRDQVRKVRLAAEKVKLEEVEERERLERERLEREQQETGEPLETFSEDDPIFTMVELYPKQKAIVLDPARFTITEATTKAGKTMSHIEWQLNEMQKFQGGNHWWVAQVKETAKIAYRRAKTRLEGYIDSKGERLKVSEPIPYKSVDSAQLIKVFGCLWSFRSGDTPDSLYGDDVYTLVGDEFSRWKPEAWTACYTTLTSTRGRAKLITNVKKDKKNFAYIIARKAEKGSPNWSHHKLTSADAVAGGVIDQAEVDQARIDLSAEDFAALYEARIIETDGKVFKQPETYFKKPETGSKIYGMDAAYSKRSSADRSVLIEAIKVMQPYKMVDGSEKMLPFYYITNMWTERTTTEVWFPKVKMRAGNNQVNWKGSGTEKGTANLAAANFGIRLNFQTVGVDKLTNAIEAVTANNQGRILLPDVDIFPDCASWVEDFKDEVLDFTGVEKDEDDDIVDALANLIGGKSVQTKGSR